jgi:DNA-binding Xre family transcriptional regulator
VNVGRIERARVLNAWTRKHLAGVAHVTPKTLTDMCSGRRRPTFGTVQAICIALGLSVADVIVFEDDNDGDVSGTPTKEPDITDGQKQLTRARQPTEQFRTNASLTSAERIRK